MAKGESVQKRLQTVRPPRVQMTYDVEVGGTTENKELPFVVGVVGDFGGDPALERKRLRERGFVAVDHANFDEVLGAVAPAAGFQVPNLLSADGGSIQVKLRFEAMADFRPEAVVAQVEPLRKLQEARTRLADLRNKLAGNDKLEDLLGEVLSNTASLAALRANSAKREG